MLWWMCRTGFGRGNLIAFWRFQLLVNLHCLISTGLPFMKDHCNLTLANSTGNKAVFLFHQHDKTLFPLFSQFAPAAGVPYRGGVQGINWSLHYHHCWSSSSQSADAGLPTLIETTYFHHRSAPTKEKATNGGLAIQLKVAPGTQFVPSMEWWRGSIRCRACDSDWSHLSLSIIYH